MTLEETLKHLGFEELSSNGKHTEYVFRGIHNGNPNDRTLLHYSGHHSANVIESAMGIIFACGSDAKAASIKRALDL